MIVVDTNLIIYLFVETDRAAEAEAVLKRDPMWVAPVLWRSEFRNTLATLVRRNALTLDAASSIVAEAEGWLQGREYTVNSSIVLRLADASRCTAYNCEFVSLAQDLGVPFVTADRQVLKAFPSLAISLSQFVT
ncbi:MAG TPA: type II toxin-antitoxin system VapC family toxin [Nitrospiraceae bacterium]|nr:type II toxin-antitoxin system VapC family toxin [Nitrospiraceae bacterium]